ncbi:MAG: NHL repeat-containing protein [Armatimonadota bacterium]
MRRFSSQGRIHLKLLVSLCVPLLLCGLVVYRQVVLNRPQQGVIRAERGAAALPGGGTVSLLGVTRSPFAGQPWWQADGTPLLKPLLPAAYDYPGSRPEGMQVPMFVLRFENVSSDFQIYHVGNQETQDHSPFDRQFRRLDNPPVDWEMRQVPAAPGTNLVFLDAHRYRPNLRELDLRLKFSDSPWQMVAMAQTDGTKGWVQRQYPIKMDDTLKVLINPPSLRQGEGVFSVAYGVKGRTAASFRQRYACRFYALDRDGHLLNTIETGQDSSTSGGLVSDSIRCSVPAAVVKQMDKLVFQLRPITTVEFPRVALTPAESTGVVRIGSVLSPSVPVAAGYENRCNWVPVNVTPLFHPTAITVDQRGCQYVIDSRPGKSGREQQTVYKIGAYDDPVTRLGRCLSRPIGIAADNQGNYYVANAGRLEKYSEYGRVRTAWEEASGRIVALACGPGDELYVALQGSSPRYCVRKYGANGKLQATFSYAGTAWRSASAYAAMMCVGSDGNLYVVSSARPGYSGNPRLLDAGGWGAGIVIDQYSPAGKLLRHWTAPCLQHQVDYAPFPYGAVNGIAVDASGVIYLSTSTDYERTIHRYASRGVFLNEIDSFGTTGRALDSDHGNSLAMDAAGVLYTFDGEQGLISTFAPKGMLLGHTRP